jgi:hypothetical protein
LGRFIPQTGPSKPKLRLYSQNFACAHRTFRTPGLLFLGLRTRLDKLPVTSISASLVSKSNAQPVTSLAPGHSAQLVVVANTADGKQLVTAGAGHGKVLLDSFVFTPALLQIDSHGKVSLVICTT